MWWNRVWNKLCTISDTVGGIPALLGGNQGEVLTRLNQIDHRIGARLHGVEQRLDAISRQATRITRLEEMDMATQADLQAALDALNGKVEAQSTVIGSGVTLLGEIKSALDAALANSDPAQALAQVQAISDKIGSDTDVLAAGIAANTPAAPPAP